MNTEQIKFVNSLRASDEAGLLKSVTDEQILAITWLALVMCRGELSNQGLIESVEVFRDESSGE